MAEGFSPKPKPSGAGVGAGPSFLLFTALILAIGYTTYLRFQNNAAQQSATNGRVTPTHIPVGFTANDLSDVYDVVKITSIVPTAGAGVTQVVIRGDEQKVPTLAGWTLRTNAGSQLIGLEGQGFAGELRVKVLNSIVNESHDRLLLFDGQGRLVNEYAY